MNHNIDFSTIDLFGRVAALGNHHNKHLFNIEKNFDALVSLIEDRHLFDQFQLLRFSNCPEREMKLITHFIRDRQTLLEMLGCYYSLQFLLMNIKAVDVLRLNLSTPSDRYQVFGRFLLSTGNDFRLLSSAYMAVLLDIFLPLKDRPDFVVCCVGTRVDQDDIDLGVIDTGLQERDKITAAFGALNTEMLKNASALHFHLSEHVGRRGYSASVQEYHELLDTEIQDVVILSEMLNAVPILGKQRIYNQFKREILERYFFHPDQDNRYHEGSLRGLLGEIRDLVMREMPENILNPKLDALRMLKAIVFAFKTWKGIDRTTTLEVLDVLRHTDPVHQGDFTKIFEALTFFETFRFLYQLIVVQEEEIYLDTQIVTENIQKVAQAMGYEDKPFAPAYTQLLNHYQDHQKLARQGAENLIRQITKHLRSITIFQSIIQRPEHRRGRPRNIAKEFIQRSRFFRGTRFWDDIFSLLEQEDSSLLNRFVKNFTDLAEMQRKKLVRTYVRWGQLSPYTLISLITIMARRQPRLSESGLIRLFLDEFIFQMENTFENVSRLCHVLNFKPRMMNNFLALLSEHHLEKLLGVVDRPIWQPDIENIQRNLVTLCQLYKNSSFYFRRFVQRVFNTYADYISSLNNQPRFAKLADGLLHNLDNFDTPEIRIEKLGDYYDFEFLRLGINLMNGESSEEINKQFTIFSDNYIQILFDLCRERVSREMQYDVPETKDLLAVFAAGGHARSQSFDDDYDLIILMNSESEEILDFANKIILQMNKHIIRRSIMTHYRFADRFKNYVTTFRNLRNFFDQPDENAFIDKSQLLGSRMIVGSALFKEAFEKEIIVPYIFRQKRTFIDALVREIVSRQKYHARQEIIDIKECPGGLRDLENFLFVLKAHFQIVEPISTHLFAKIMDRMPEHGELLRTLKQHYYFLKHIRDLYHLMVSDNDEIQVEYLDRIIEPLSSARAAKFDSPQALCRHVRVMMSENVNGIHRILDATIAPK